MKLLENNGLAKLVFQIAGKHIDIYYNDNKSEVVIYAFNCNVNIVEQIKTKVVRYINFNNLFSAYERLTIYT